MFANMVYICNSVMFISYTQIFSNHMFLACFCRSSHFWQPEEVHCIHTDQQHPRDFTLPPLHPCQRSSPSGNCHHPLHRPGHWHGQHAYLLIYSVLLSGFQVLTMAILIIEDIFFKLRGFSSLHYCCRFLDFTMLFLMSCPLLYSEHVLCLGPHSPWGANLVWGGAFSTYVQTIHIICGLWQVNVCGRTMEGPLGNLA